MNSKATPPADWNPAEQLDIAARIQYMNAMRERCPVAYTDRAGGYWGLLRYDDIVAATLDPVTFRNGGSPRHGHVLPPLEVDLPDHREYRRLLTPFFTSRRMQQLEPQVRGFAQQLLESILQRPTVDLARDYSYPLPVLTLCTVLGFGIDRWAEIKSVSEDTLLIESADPDERERARRAHEQLLSLARELVADRRRQPRDHEQDMPSAILAASIAGRAVDDEVAAGMLRLLISAGHNSTTSSLGNAMLYLAQHGDEQQRLRDDPTRISAAIEELLRFDTPVQAMPRYTTRNVTVNDRTIPEGQKVDLFWAAANRDGHAFPEPDCCLLDRQPNRHLAFGHGIHLCIGAPMARLELRVALEELLSRTRTFTLTGTATRTPFHRVGVTSLPVSIVAV